MSGWLGVRVNVDRFGRVLKSVARLAAVGGVLLAAAMAIAALVVTVHLTLTGDLASRTLWAAIAAALVPVLLILAGRFSDLLVKVDSHGVGPRHLVVLTALTAMLCTLGLSQQVWLPGVLAGCYSSGSGIPAFVLASDGQCYGLIDDASSRLRGPEAFGNDSVAKDLQTELLGGNRSLRADDLTVVWVAPLSCRTAPGDSSVCADRRDHSSERQQMRALRLAQQAIADEKKYRLHVVIANAGQDTAHADQLAQLIVDRRDALGDRLAVIFGGDSRDVTQQAIGTLLDAGIPVISPNLAGDLNRAGRPFVDRAGYLQLTAPNQRFAEDLMQRLVLQYAKDFQLLVYQVPKPGDQYTTSLVNDVIAAAHDRKVNARHVTSLEDLDTSICADAPGPPTVVFYADRWSTFDKFVRRADGRCRYAGPTRVIADVSVSRFMASNAMRANTSADWALDYYTSGVQCADLADPRLQRQLAQTRPKLACPPVKPTPATDSPYCTLDAADSSTYSCDPTDLGPYITPTWDAVMLADRLPPTTQKDRKNDTQKDRENYLRNLQADKIPFSGETGELKPSEEEAGRPKSNKVSIKEDSQPVVPIRLLRVDHIDRLTDAPYRLEP